ncbi:MAG TPA: hydrogenase maturation protease [Polyangiaceae bacterium]|nr:hydrogenase maturation protease [Polyangiaceae bacterium]
MRWLVIGYGNPLRRDDGLGHYLARCVQRARLPHVEVQLEIELLPELSLELRRAPRVLFVDASLDPSVLGVQLTRLPATPAELSDQTRREQAPVSHVGGPASLLSTCMALYGAMPEGHALAISGYDLGFGVGLSRAARRNLRRARQIAFELLR